MKSMNKEKSSPVSILDKMLSKQATMETGAFYKSVRAERRTHATLNPTLTRIAVELTCPDSHADTRAINLLLDSLRELTSLSCIVVAMFDDARERIEVINAA